MSRPRGFSLVEILISVVIFSAVVLGLAGLSFQVARRATRATDQALVMGSLVSALDRASTIDYDSLATLARCDTTASGTTKVISCTSIAATTTLATTLRIIVRTTVPGGRPDTVIFDRGKIRRPVPLR